MNLPPDIHSFLLAYWLPISPTVHLLRFCPYPAVMMIPVIYPNMPFLFWSILLLIEVSKCSYSSIFVIKSFLTLFFIPLYSLGISLPYPSVPPHVISGAVIFICRFGIFCQTYYWSPYLLPPWHFGHIILIPLIWIILLVGW